MTGNLHRDDTQPHCHNVRDALRHVGVELELLTPTALSAITPLSWDFTTRWFASFGSFDQRQPEQRPNKNAVGATVPLPGATACCSSPMASAAAPGRFLRLARQVALGDRVDGIVRIRLA